MNPGWNCRGYAAGLGPIDEEEVGGVMLSEEVEECLAVWYANIALSETYSMPTRERPERMRRASKMFRLKPRVVGVVRTA